MQILDHAVLQPGHNDVELGLPVPHVQAALTIDVDRVRDKTPVRARRESFDVPRQLRRDALHAPRERCEPQ